MHIELIALRNWCRNDRIKNNASEFMLNNLNIIWLLYIM